MNFSLKIKNPPAGSAYWHGSFRLDSVSYFTGVLLVAQGYSFKDVKAGHGYVYADCYDSEDNALTDGKWRGYLAPADGSIWEYDFVLNQMSEVGAVPGQSFAQIISVTPGLSEAPAGRLIAVSIKVKNSGGSAGNILVTAAVYWKGGYTFPSPTPNYIYLLPGVQGDFQISFGMPNADCEIVVWPYHWDGTKWVLDGDPTRAYVTLAVAPVPELKFSAFEITEYMKV